MTLGIGLPWQWAETDPGYYARALALLHPPHWYTWKHDGMGRAGFVPMLYAAELGSPLTAAIAAARAHPGQTWLLGNEPESAQQSNTSPHEYRTAANTWQALVGLRWAGPGVLWGDEGRAWLDTYLRIGGPVPPQWAIHIYGSTTWTGWLTQYRHAQNWLAERGVTRPLWVTETNGSEEILRKLVASRAILAFWYSAHDPFASMSAADLTNADATSLTELGKVYAGLYGVAAASTVPPRYMPLVRN